MENQSNLSEGQPGESTAAQAAPPVSPEKVAQYIEKIRLEQNLPIGIAAGIIACLVSAGLWALITVLTKYQIGYMAIGVGFLVGFAIRFAGKGIDKIFGIVGALLALVGCALGNFFSVVSFTADEMGSTFGEVLGLIDLQSIPSILFETGSPMDLLFYGIAVYVGYKFSFRQVTEEEIVKNAA